MTIRGGGDIEVGRVERKGGWLTSSVSKRKKIKRNEDQIEITYKSPNNR